jgi:hypothetical protein
MKTPEQELKRITDKTHPPVEVKVERALGVKCPRCWNYHTIQFNPMDCCDRCVRAVTEMLPYLVENNLWTEADCEEWRELVRQSVNRWKAKT